MVTFGKIGATSHIRRLDAFLNNRNIRARMFPRAEMSGSGGGQAVKKLKILVAEDDCVFSGVLKETFEIICPGFEIFEAADGLAALDMAKKIPSGSLNIGFIDTRMAGKNGFDVCKELRTMHPSVYLILKSGGVDEKHWKYKDEGIVDAVFDTRNLSLNLDPIIEEAIKTASARSSAPSTPNLMELLKMATRKPRILLVDDYDLSLASHKDQFILHYPGCEVSTANNGIEALALAEKYAAGYFDILFTDTNMPEMDGFTLSDKFREKYPSTYIVLKSSCEVGKHMEYLSTGKVDALFLFGSMSYAESKQILDKAILTVLERLSLKNNNELSKPENA
jgi:CheY-like chemotaxis protein